tara:strand:+ start:150 stop:518 length:369 start_codon:yes stop_codon:yes gene_type:complete
MMIVRTMALLVLVLCSCSVTPRVSSLTPKYVPDVTAPPGEPLAMLSWISGLSILGGIALLVVTSGRKGKWAIGAGVGLILLNLLIHRFDNYLFIPVLVCTGLISAVWTYKLIRQTLTEKKNK